ncbi:hypothetical protein GS399_05750 [Pedobacter sp. HMF7647]|uniref:DUF6799 domain-containing protein n=2 Tax=Hufsiella arboris TaxID=2695275 RepID=A0A7K1Y7S2_9SPHI|nr:hypothetical protein [Hufsiella arboris]
MSAALAVTYLACLSSAYAMPVNPSTARQDTTKSKMKMDHQMKDCVMMEDGKMMLMKDGKTMEMTKDMALKNGTMIMTDGTVKSKSGKSMKLKNGESVDMNGKMMPMHKM